MTPRTQLGGELKAARLAARDGQGINRSEVAEMLGVTVDTISRYETGKSTIRKADLAQMMNLYGIKDPNHRAVLEELRQQGNQTTWWSAHRLPEYMTRLLGFESMTIGVKGVEPLLVPGQLQTEAYAREIIRRVAPTLTSEQVERGVAVRLQRQERLFNRANPPVLHIVLDEAVVRRKVGDASILREQLAYLLEGPYEYTLQVVPTLAGPHPAMLGSFYLFEFPSHVRRPALYSDGPVRNIYLDDAEEVRQASVNFDRIVGMALSPEDSRGLIAAIMKEVS